MQNCQSPGDSLTNISKPPQGTQDIQGNQSPEIGTQLEGGGHSVAVQTKETHALHIAGSILEKGLNTLKGFADFIPMAPGLGPALEVVCGCIEVYHVSISMIVKNKLLEIDPNH